MRLKTPIAGATDHRLHKAMVRLLTLCFAVYALLAAGCSDPCDELQVRVCSEASNEEQCTKWRKIIDTVSPETCRVSLQRLDQILR